jgi:hypothetical protein
VESLLQYRGSAPRRFRNMPVFLAPDKTRLAELESGLRQYLAWKSIDAEADTLNLDTFQRKQASTRLADADSTVESRILETYVWLLVPEQPEALGPIEWQELKVQGQDALAVRAMRKLKNDELMVLGYSAVRLKGDLDTYIWRERDHISLRELWECYASYPYLTRLRDREVMLKAVLEGVA